MSLLNLTALLCMTAPDPTAAAHALAAALAQPDAPLVLDVRPRADFDRGHIQGAVPLKAWQLRQHPAAKSAVIIGGPLVEGALPGGMSGWCRAGLSVVGTCDGLDRVDARIAMAGEATGATLLTARGPAPPPGGTVFVASDSASVVTWARTLKNHVFVVRGGAKAYQAAVSMQAAMKDRRTVISSGSTRQPQAAVQAKEGCACRR